MIPRNPLCTDIAAADGDRFDPDYVSDVLDRHGRNGSSLLSILADIQERFRYLPQEALRIVSRETGRPLVEIYAAATFYKSFSLSPKGKHTATVCLGTACHVRGGQRVVDEFGKQLGIGPGETTRDCEFTLETVNCLGACALGPVAVVDGRYFCNVNAAGVSKIIEAARQGRLRHAGGGDSAAFAVEAACPRCGRSLMDPRHPIDGFPSIRLCVSDGRGEGWARLSSLYGACAVESERETPENALVEVFCPECGESLRTDRHCPECGAPMAELTVRGGGILSVCCRFGCSGHSLDLVGELVGAASLDFAALDEGN